MGKLTNTMETKFLPLAQKFSHQKYLQAISNAFLSIIPFLTIGSLALVITCPPVDYTTLEPGFLHSFFKGWAALAAAIGTPVGQISSICMDYMAIYVAGGIGFFLARHYKMKGFLPVASSIVNFFLLAGFSADGSRTLDYFGGMGLFVAIFSSILTIELLRFLLDRKVGKISLEGQGVPETITESFAALVPSLITMAAAALLSWVIVLITKDTLPNLMTLIMSPFITAVDSIWGVVIFSLLVCIFWWFGIHDSCITGPMSPLLTATLVANTAAYAAHTTLPHIVTKPFWWMFMAIGGSGATFGLCLVLLFACKSKQLRTVGKLGIVPAFFNINEPVIFGVPIMLNPVMFIPFVSAMTINAILVYICMATGLVAKCFSYPGWNMFCPIGALLATMDIKALILVVVLIVVDALIYLPFTLALDRQKLKEERSAADETAAQ